MAKKDSNAKEKVNSDLDANYEKVKAVESFLREELKEKYELFLHGKFRTPRNFRICIPCIVETQDYAIFQSEVHTLDKVWLSAGFEKGTENKIGTEDKIIERAECHESKIKQEIRRTGKELTRKVNVIIETESTNRNEKKEGKQECHIPDALCGKCIDCSLWGFAAKAGEGETGQPSRIEVGTAYSIRQIDEIMRDRTWNAVDENARRVLEALGSKEQLQPQIFLPYVIDLKDSNLDELIYLLYSVYNANRIGAGSTKYGAISIHPMGVFFAYESLFSNLVLTKRAYDYLLSKRKDQLTEKAKQMGWIGDITLSQAKEAIRNAISTEFDNATCPAFSLTDEKFKNLENQCVDIFKNTDVMKTIIAKNSGL